MEISFVGSGNVAWHLAVFLRQHGHSIETIYNRSPDRGRLLAQEIDAKYAPLDVDICPGSDLLIITVSDDAIPKVIDKISAKTKSIVTHTSGAIQMDVLEKFERFGVIYPPQSLNKEISSNLSDIPFAIEGSDRQTQEDILALIHPIATKSFFCDSRQRLTLHTAAVFVNNFVNALYQIGYDLLKQEKLDFELLRPIILETAQKVQKNIPKDVQTGPAARNDTKTINRHLDLLSDNTNTQQIYQQLTSFLINEIQKR